MWRLPLLGLCLSLSGCGFTAWHNFPFVAGQDPYMPAGDAENLRRAQGIPVNAPPLTTEPGDIWPGPVQSEPTLKTWTGERSVAEPGDAAADAAHPRQLYAARACASHPAGARIAPVAPPAIPAVPPVGPPVAGAPYQTPQGTGVTSGGTSAYKTITMPNGSTAIVVPNGNGTSTVINSNGTVQTIPTPK